MRQLRPGLVVALTCAATALGTAGPGLSAPGGGAISAPTTCLLSVPGYGDVTGSGRVVLTPSGKQTVTCHASLPAGTQAPGKPVELGAGACKITIVPSGTVVAHCNQ